MRALHVMKRVVVIACVLLGLLLLSRVAAVFIGGLLLLCWVADDTVRGSAARETAASC